MLQKAEEIEQSNIELEAGYVTLYDFNLANEVTLTGRNQRSPGKQHCLAARWSF